MPTSPSIAEQRKEFVARAVEAAVRIALIAVMGMWCFEITRPFITFLVWGVVIAVAIQPLNAWLGAHLRGRRGLSALIITLVSLVVMLAPTILLLRSLLDGLTRLADLVRSGELTIPPPPATLEHWPMAGSWVHTVWAMAADDLHELIVKLAPQLKPFGVWLVRTGSGLGLSVLKFCAAICVAGVLLFRAEAGQRFAVRLGARLFGEYAADYLHTATATVRSVALGVLGVAVIQSLLAAAGFVIAGIPFAGLWAFLVLLAAIVQIPSLLVLAPLCAYAYAQFSPTAATVFTVWCLAVGLSDNVLKPILFGRGVQIPMLIILLGALGGMMATGIIGLFLGAVVLSLGYMLFGAWLRTDPETPAP